MLSNKPITLFSREGAVILPNKCIFCGCDAEVFMRRNVASYNVNPSISLDFEIPYCTRHRELSEILDKNKSQKLLWAFSIFPLIGSYFLLKYFLKISDKAAGLFILSAFSSGLFCLYVSSSLTDAD